MLGLPKLSGLPKKVKKELRATKEKERKIPSCRRFFLDGCWAALLHFPLLIVVASFLSCQDSTTQKKKNPMNCNCVINLIDKDQSVRVCAQSAWTAWTNLDSHQATLAPGHLGGVCR